MKTTIIDHLKEPIIVSKFVSSDVKTIMYVYADAFTTCDCGKDLMLSQRVFGDLTYSGMCSCGKSWALLNGKIKSWWNNRSKDSINATMLIK